MPRKKNREVCPTCRLMGVTSRIYRMQPIEEVEHSQWTQAGTRYRYRCSRGHEFDGENVHVDENYEAFKEIEE